MGPEAARQADQGVTVIPTTIIPEHDYPGQIFDELGSLAYNMPLYPRLAFDLWSIPGSRDVVNSAASAVMTSGITPYGE